PIEGELGERGLTLRATDSMNNVATAHVDAPKRYPGSELRVPVQALTVARVAVSARFLFGGSCRSAAGDLLARTVARSKSHKTFAVTDRRGVWPSKRERETASSNPSIISTCSAAVA